MAGTSLPDRSSKRDGTGQEQYVLLQCETLLVMEVIVASVFNALESDHRLNLRSKLT